MEPLGARHTLAVTASAVGSERSVVPARSVVPEAVLELDALAVRLSAVDRRLVLPLAASADALLACRAWTPYS